MALQPNPTLMSVEVVVELVVATSVGVTAATWRLLELLRATLRRLLLPLNRLNRA